VSLNLSGLTGAAHKARLVTLKGNSVWATNTIDHPERIVPAASAVTVNGSKLDHTMPPYSIQLLELDLK
jgi:alpha-N-arabinofuranosidase